MQVHLLKTRRWIGGTAPLKEKKRTCQPKNRLLKPIFTYSNTTFVLGGIGSRCQINCLDYLGQFLQISWQWFFLTLAQSCMAVKLLKVCCMVLVPICCSLQMVPCWVDYWFDMCCSSQEWWEMNMTMSCRGWLWRNWLYVYSYIIYIYNTYVYIYIHVIYIYMYLVLHDIDLFDTCSDDICHVYV